MRTASGCIFGHRMAGCLTSLAVILISGLAQLAFLPAPAQAADPIKLVVGGTGSMPFNEPDIKPCFKGTRTVTLQNAGLLAGTVTIWISDIVSGEGLNPKSETGDTAEPGELDQYMLFNLTGSDLSANMTLPAIIGDFPQSVTDPNYLRVARLDPGQTVTLVWDWELPCQTGNDAQGDNLSFSIKYTLEEIPGGGVTPGSGGGVWDPKDLLRQVPITPTPRPVLERGCCGVSPDDILHLKLELINQGRYDTEGVTLNCVMPPELIVAGAEPVPSVTFAGQKVTANLGTIKSNDSKIIMITVRVHKSVEPDCCIMEFLERVRLDVSDNAKPCAAGDYNLSVSNLAIDPVVNLYWPLVSWVKISGEQANVAVKATNVCQSWRYKAIISQDNESCHTREITRTGEVAGKDTYNLNLKINGADVQTRQVNLGKGASQGVSFAPAQVKTGSWQFPGRVSSFWWIIPTGTYQVDVNGQQGQFNSELSINWLLILFILVMIALFIWAYTLSRKPSRRR